MDTHVARRARSAVRVLLPVISLALCAGCEQILLPIEQASGWIRHTIDDRFRGADGVKLGDVDADGLLDLVVPWEESGLVIVYLNHARNMSIGSVPLPAV